MTGRRVFYFGEMNRLLAAENIDGAYQDRQRSKNWAEWATENPGLSRLLNEAIKIHATSDTGR